MNSASKEEGELFFLKINIIVVIVAWKLGGENLVQLHSSHHPSEFQNSQTINDELKASEEKMAELVSLGEGTKEGRTALCSSSHFSTAAQ